jgi:hypothetical protein
MAVATDIQQQVFNLLSRASNISFVTADQGSGEVSFLTPGQRVNAVVLSQQPNNRVQVGVGTERFNLDLPMSVRTGQTLEMTFVATEPRATFAIARQAGIAPPVTLSDASRLLSILVSSEKIIDPQLRTSLQSVGDLLRRSSGETAVLANLLDEALTYGSGRDKSTMPLPVGAGAKGAGTGESGSGRVTPDQARLATFETNAAQILKNIAQNSRFTLIEAVTHPVTSLPLLPGEEINATVVGTLAGGRSIVQMAGTTLELVLPHKVVPGEIVRLTYLSAEPKPTFALGRAIPDSAPPLLSEAGRWLSVLEHSEGGVSRQQAYVLERLNMVLKSLPPNSPALSLISDDAQTYQRAARPAPDLPAGVVTSSAPSPAPSGNGLVLSDDMARLLQAVIKGNRLALLESLSQQGPASSFMPGQQLKGDVLASLGGGRFSVQVAGQVLEFILPKGVRRGDLINLFFISNEPQQTFLMARFGRSGESKVTDVSRWLSGFLGEAAGQVSTQSTLGILRTLLSGPTTDAQLLGRMLQQGLRESGLFYESHLARWFGGSYPLEDILKEPQGRLSPRLAQAGTRYVESAEDLVRSGFQTGSTEMMAAIIKKAGSSMGHEGVADQRTLPMVNEQLTALQNGQLLFRGDLFPGQRLEWTVTEREAGRNKSGGRERSWETSVTINLPNLGPVTAQLTLDGIGVAVAITAENGGAVPILETGRARLIEQLEGAGLTPAAMSIGHAAA